MGPGVQVDVCPHCRGGQLAQAMGDDGTPELCGGCDGSGRVVTCLECADEMPEPEAAEHGAYCGDCRHLLDRLDEEAHRDDIRRFARAI